MNPADRDAELESLRRQLADAQATIAAIASGEADAFVVDEAGAPRICTLEGADQVYRLLVEHMQQGAATLTKEGDLIYANSRFAELVGIPAPDLLGKSLRQFLPTDDWGALAGSCQFETRLRHRAGHSLPVILTINVLEPKSGVAAGVLVTDLSQQQQQDGLKQALDRLRISEERYRSLFNSIDEGFCVIEVVFDDAGQPMDYQFLEVNSVFEKQSGLMDAVGKRMRQLAPEIEPFWIERYGHVAATGEPARFVNEAKILNRWFDVYAFRVGDPRMHHVAILFSDITQKRLVAEELSQARSRLTSTLAAAEIGTWEFDPLQNCVTADVNLQQMFGVARVRDTGLPLERYLEAVHVEDRGRLLRAIQDSLASGETYQCEYRLVVDGETSYVVSRGRVERDEAGQARRLAGVVIDVTERTLAEQKLQRLADHLAQNDRRKDEFLATLAHELRNPLSPILSCAQLMQLQPDDPARQLELSAVIERQAANMVRLIDDLLDVSRISRGKFSLQKQLCSLQNVLTAAVEASLPFIEQSGQTLEVEPLQEELWVSGDAVRLTQVLVNLLNNAAKYTPAGGNIELSVRRDGDWGVMSVKDDGIGLAPADLSRVFEMFEQVDVSKERGQSGLGIGLSLVQTLARLHGGDVSASSQGHGLGSTFTVRLPLQPAPTNTQSYPLKPSSETEATRYRVLVVEDTRSIRVGMSRLLQALGHDVETAADGEEGYAKAVDWRPDIVFSDISMPLMNGHELAAKIRKNENLSHLTLVALTGFGQAADREHAFRHGFDDHMTKPPDINRLRKFFAQHAARHH